LVEEAVRLGLDGLALTDHDGFYGAPVFAEAAAELGLATVYGAELSIGLPGPQAGVADPDGDHLLVLAGGLSGYRRLAGVITDGHLAGGKKNRPRFDLEDLAAAGAGDWTVLTCRKGLGHLAVKFRFGPEIHHSSPFATSTKFPWTPCWRRSSSP
jgi:error-prone DNA polymerase